MKPCTDVHECAYNRRGHGHVQYGRIPRHWFARVLGLTSLGRICYHIRRLNSTQQLTSHFHLIIRQSNTDYQDGGFISAFLTVRLTGSSINMDETCQKIKAKASFVDGSDPHMLKVQWENGKPDEDITFENVVAAVPLCAGEHRRTYNLLYMKRPAKDEEEKSVVYVVQVEDLPTAFIEEHPVQTRPSHLSIPKNQDGGSNIHVIVSIRSGTLEAAPYFENAVRPVFCALSLSKKDYEVHHTASEQSVIDFASNTLYPRANAGTPQTVLLLSGDGGIVDIVNVLLQNTQSNHYVKPSIGLIALGTGNALANSTGLNRDITRGLNSFIRGHPRSLPTFTARFSAGSELLTDEGKKAVPLSIDTSGTGIVHGAVVCSWALHASLVADSDTAEYRKYGAQRFQMAAQELLKPSDGSEPHHYRGRISLTKKDANGQESTTYLDQKEHTYILATLVSKLEQSLTISPASKPLDGQLRFLHFGALPGDEILRILGLAFAGGKHIQEEPVGYEPIEALRIEFDEPEARWRRVCVDGKIIRVGEGGWVEVRREGRDVLDLIVDL